MIQMKEVFMKNWHYIIGSLLVLIMLVNTGSLLLTLQAQNQMIEQPSKETINYINPYRIDSVDTMDYFNHSIYMYDNYSIVQMEFNENFTNFQSIKTTKLIPYPNDPGYGFIGKVTTNGKRTFVLDESYPNYPILEVTQP